MQIKDLTINDAFRYACGGILLAVLAAWIDPELINSISATLGAVLWPIAVLALGAIVYTIYRVAIGDCLMFYLLVWSEGYWRRNGHCKYRYVAEAVNLRDDSPFMARRAFQLLRDLNMAYSESNRTQFHREHSELNLIYLIGFVVFIGAIWYGVRYTSLCGEEIAWSPWIMVVFAIGCWVVAVRANLSLDRREYDQLVNSAAIHQDNWRSVCQNAGLCRDLK